jgi:hypothetical protein
VPRVDDDAALVGGRVPSCSNIGSWAVAGGRIASYLPFTINTGVLTRGRKLAGVHLRQLAKERCEAAREQRRGGEPPLQGEYDRRHLRAML